MYLIGFFVFFFPPPHLELRELMEDVAGVGAASVGQVGAEAAHLLGQVVHVAAELLPPGPVGHGLQQGGVAQDALQDVHVDFQRGLRQLELLSVLRGCGEKVSAPPDGPGGGSLPRWKRSPRRRSYLTRFNAPDDAVEGRVSADVHALQILKRRNTQPQHTEEKCEHAERHASHQQQAETDGPKCCNALSLPTCRKTPEIMMAKHDQHINKPKHA